MPTQKYFNFQIAVNMFTFILYLHRVTCRIPSPSVAHNYLQYQFDGEGKQKMIKNEGKKIIKERREKKKRNPSMQAAIQRNSLEFRKMPF